MTHIKDYVDEISFNDCVRMIDEYNDLENGTPLSADSTMRHHTMKYMAKHEMPRSRFLLVTGLLAAGIWRQFATDEDGRLRGANPIRLTEEELRAELSEYMTTSVRPLDFVSEKPRKDRAVWLNLLQNLENEKTKIYAIKAVRDLSGMGLIESKKLVEEYL